MSNAHRDENRITEMMVEDANGNLVPLIVDAVTGRLKVNTTITGAIEVASLVSEPHDAIALNQTATEDIWTYYTGGLTGDLVATVTVTFTGADKETISNVVRT